MRFRQMAIGLAVLAGVVILGGSLFYALALRPKAHPDTPSVSLDRVFLIVLETYRPSNTDPASIGPPELAPFLSKLAMENRVAVNYFGVWSPSLPNYIAMLGGDTFGIGSNAESCFSSDRTGDCNSADAPNLVDQLEAAQIPWEGLFESMPSPGFLGPVFPAKPALYAQKHNPFVYFKNIADAPARLAKLKPLELDALKAELANPATASRFIYLVPDLCHDQHGAKGCRPATVTIAEGDEYLSKLVPLIVGSPAFTERSVLFITWDNAQHGHAACCGDWWGGGRIPLIALTRHKLPARGTMPANHYSLLATIEDAFGLPRLAHARAASTLFELLPDLADNQPSGSGEQNGKISSAP